MISNPNFSIAIFGLVMGYYFPQTIGGAVAWVAAYTLLIIIVLRLERSFPVSIASIFTGFGFLVHLITNLFTGASQ